MKCILPFHQTNTFVRMVQLLKVKYAFDSNFSSFFFCSAKAVMIPIPIPATIREPIK